MSLENKTNINADLNGLVDKLFELSPKYQAIKIYNDEMKNNLNLSVGEKIAYTLERHKILKQAKNFASTLNLADLMLKDDKKSLEKEILNLDDDWFDYYSDVVENFSDKNMQTIWAKILVEECQNKGSVSKRIISILQVIDKAEAEAFSYICSHIISFKNVNEEECHYEFIYPEGERGYKKLRDFYESSPINHEMLVNLESIGLIKTHILGFSTGSKESICKYFDTEFRLKDKFNRGIPTGYAILTFDGEKLARVIHKNIECEKDDEYLDSILEYYKNYI